MPLFRESDPHRYSHDLTVRRESFVPDGKGQLCLHQQEITLYGHGAIDHALDTFFPDMKPKRVQVTQTTWSAVDDIPCLLVDFEYEMPPFIPESVSGL